ncbi:bifunctional metallophosphatase/5'-nucleotidase [Gulosibacter hominis]|uniref:bifunctional metallophosphatase/5'-nucleotidase n=1 Tax=Gulosibacter hominis TaxID=2770504 RepID=UPI001919526B|nr:bifunctional UDP-sugar hydrolase/5'-nucleotidase [Gulosibacter hominis]
MAHKKNFVRGAVASVVGGLLAFAGIAAPAFADESLQNTEIISPAADLAEGQKQINIVSYNDFHGRLSNLEAFAAGSLTIADKFGAENTLFVANGDQVGASEFESSLQNDDPTMDALTALSEGSQHSFTVGNHEFDKGQEDAERIRQKLGGTLLAANVTKGDGSLLMDAYKIYEVNGVKVAVIGAVTESTPSAVSPQGIQGLTFGDPVAAVNKYAEEIEQAGAADIIIASYHEGGPTADLDTNLGNEVFSSMVKDTSDKVDLVLHGHTHYGYNYDISERRVLQAGEYGKQVGQIVFTVDADNKIVKTDSAVIDTIADKAPVYTRDGLSPQSQQVYDKVVGIKEAAYKEAEVLGAEQIGVVNDDITRAYTWADGAAVKDDRAEASSLGVLVADSMYQWANKNVAGGADLSIMNPGGLRADIAGDGVLTYKDAQTVLPFTNNLAVVTLKGAQLKQVFEEQWQRDANGEVPSRPYLQLGISPNVSYTSDSSRAEGDRITGITIDGNPLNMDAEYKVVMPTFLAGGGDNFHTLAEGTMFDTGSIDLDAFTEYVKDLPGQELKVPTARPGVDTEGFFTAYGEGPTVKAGEDFTFKVKNFNLRSKEFLANESIDVKIGEKIVGTGTITGDTANGDVVEAEITVNIPADFEGKQNLTLVFNQSGTAAVLPLTVAEAEGEAPSIAVDPEKVTVEKSAEGILISGSGWNAGEEVTLTVTGPEGINAQFTVMPNEAGEFSESITWATFDKATGEVIADNQPFPAGTYTVVATQGDAEATATFEVVADEASPLPNEPGKEDEAAGGKTPAEGGLAATGADSNLLVGGIAVALLIAATGATLVAQRRNA